MTQKIKKLMVDVIEEAADTQARVALSQETIDEYSESIAAILKEHPIDVFFDGMCYFIGDGWHRFLAALKAELTVVPCIVHDGTERDALLFAAAANKSHGLKRTNRDKRRAVEIMFADSEWSTWSDRKIAEHCGVSDKTVAQVREAVTPPPKQKPAGAEIPHLPKTEKREGRDGKTYPVKPKPAPAPPADEPEPPTLQERMDEWNHSVESFARSITALAKSAPEGGWWDDSQANITAQQLKSAAGSARQAKCDNVCPKCGGNGCQHCRREGFVPRRTYEMLGGGK